MHLLTTLELPRLVGARDSAKALTTSLPDDCSGQNISVNAINLISAAQGFTDELVKQILVKRNARGLYVENATSVFRRHLDASAKSRQVAEHLVVNER
jgi:hypothetical protein